MKRKKGMLLASETLKLILAVISIGFLIYLLSAIYFSATYSKEKAQADATIEKIGEVVANLNIGNISSETLTEVTPFGWMVFSFTGEEKKPNSCAEGNCLCICDEVVSEFLGILGDRQLAECGEEGVCLVVPTLKEFEDFEIGGGNSPTSFSISKVGEFIEVNQR